MTQICRQCEFKSFCHGGCPKHRISSVEGEHFKHNYLCASYQYFFRQTAEDMQQMSNQIRFAKT